jgi:hypothetical protein
MKGISTMWGLEPQTFLILCAVGTFAVLGLVQLIKGRVKIPARVLAIVFSLLCAIMQTDLIPRAVTDIFNLFTCILSAVTLLSQLGITIKGATVGREDKITEAIGKALEQLPDTAVQALKNKLGAK